MTGIAGAPRLHGAGRSWTAAGDADVYAALLETVRSIAPGGEGLAAGHRYRGTGDGRAAVGSPWDADAAELTAEVPLDQTALPRSGFLSRVAAPLSRLTTLLLVWRRGGGHLRLQDVPPT
jgi:hypothetical protein